jgi:valyl-tRNA synthetase
MNDDGTINELGGKYCGLDRIEARAMGGGGAKELGVLDKLRNIPICRAVLTLFHDGGPDFQQWFVSMQSLAMPALELCARGRCAFSGGFDKIYFNWMENIRGLVYLPAASGGDHRIPAYYCRRLRRDGCCKRRRRFVRLAAGMMQMRTYWTHWLARGFGLFPLWGWLKKQRIWSFSIRPRIGNRYDIIFFGWRG